MKQTRKRWADALFALVLITCLVVCFSTGWLNEYTGGWDSESEGYVIGRMYQMQRSLTQDNPAGFMGIYRDEVNFYTTADLFLQDAPVSSDIFWTYTHQSGMQGTAAGAINLALCALKLPPQSRLLVLTTLNTWLFCVLFAAICLWVYREMGFVAAALCCAGTLFSPWAMCSMGNLYWVMWLYLLPFVLCAYLCRRYEVANKLPKWVYPMVAGGVLLRFLCGFEFTSTILICTEIPVVYYAIKHWNDAENRATQRKKWLMTAVWLGVWCLAAFAVAMLALCVQTMLHFGSFARGIEEIMQTVSFRTGAFSGTFQPPGIYNESLSVPLLEVLRRYFAQETVVGGLTMGALFLAYTVLAALTAALFTVKKRAALTLRCAKLYAVVLAAMLAPISWFVLARGHSSLHVGINYVLWLLPALPLLLAHCGWCAQTAQRVLAGAQCADAQPSAKEESV